MEMQQPVHEIDWVYVGFLISILVSMLSIPVIIWIKNRNEPVVNYYNGEDEDCLTEMVGLYMLYNL